MIKLKSSFLHNFKCQNQNQTLALITRREDLRWCGQGSRHLHVLFLRGVRHGNSRECSRERIKTLSNKKQTWFTAQHKQCQTDCEIKTERPNRPQPTSGLETLAQNDNRKQVRRLNGGKWNMCHRLNRNKYKKQKINPTINTKNNKRLSKTHRSWPDVHLVTHDSPT